MKDRPILMHARSIQNLFAGRKSQTRRIVKPQPLDEPELCLAPTGLWLNADYPGSPADAIRCPYGQPGDLLYVKEAIWLWCDRVPDGPTKTGHQKYRYEPMLDAPFHYVADMSKPSTNVVSPSSGDWTWRAKIARFAPRWASRITLELTEVRVERVQDCSEEDAAAEGCPLECMRPDGEDNGSFIHGPGGFARLWDDTNGPGAWERNDWVWALTFDAYAMNVDEFIKGRTSHQTGCKPFRVKPISRQAAEDADHRVDCGDCPNVTSGCRAGHCLRARSTRATSGVA